MIYGISLHEKIYGKMEISREKHFLLQHFHNAIKRVGITPSFLLKNLTPNIQLTLSMELKHLSDVWVLKDKKVSADEQRIWMQSCRSATQMCACCKQYERIFKFTENEMTSFIYIWYFFLKIHDCCIDSYCCIAAHTNFKEHACLYISTIEKTLTYQLIAMTVRFALWRFHHATCLKVIKSKLIKINFTDLLNKLFVKHFLSTGLFITVCLIIPRFWT